MPKPSVYIAGKQVDLVENELDKLLSNHAIADSENLQNRSSSVSRIIKASGSRSNRRLFGNLHLGISNSNLEEGIEAWIEYQGIKYLRGQYRFIKTKRKGNSIEFHFMIIGQNSWSQLLPKRTLKDIDLSKYDHYFSPEVILWSQANTDKSVFLYTHPQPESESSVKPSEFNFALNVRRLFKEIFKRAGFRIVSEFIDSDYCSRFWFHPQFLEKDSEYWDKKAAIAGNETALNHTTPSGSGIQEIEVPLEFDLDEPEITVSGDLVNTGFKDEFDHFNTSSEEYTVSEDGGYRVKFHFNFASGSNRADINTVYLFINGLERQQVNISDQEIIDNDGRIDLRFEDLYLKAGQVVSMKMTYTHNFSTSTFRTYKADPYDTYIQIEALTSLTNYERVSINDYFLGSETQLQLVGDCAILWNLQFITDEQTKTVFIEPEGNFYTSEKESIDSRIDGSKEIELSNMAHLLSREIRFRYKDEESGEVIENPKGAIGSQDVSLSFFSKTNLVDALLHYKGAKVLEGTGKNNLFYCQGSKNVQKHTLYRVNNDYTFQPGANVIPQTESLPDIRFSDETINLNFEEVDFPGLRQKFYSALPARINSDQKQVTAYIDWSLLAISNLDSNAASDDNGFRKSYLSNEHGLLRLSEIQNFDSTRNGSTKTILVQDYPHAPFQTTANSHSDLVELENKFVVISSVFINRVASFPNPVDIGYTITVEQIGLIAEYATLQWPYYKSLDNVTVKTNPNGFQTLSKALGSGDIAEDELRDNSNIEVSIIPPSVNYQGLAPLHFYSDGFTHPVWLCGYGYFNKITVGDTFEILAYIRSISSGIYSTSNCYVNLEIQDPPTSIIGTPFTMPINTDEDYTFELSLPEPGIYTYSIYLYSDYQGATQLVDQITSKLYVNE